MSQLAELRKIIVGEQADQLDSIKERLEEVALRSKDVAEVLPEAILQADDDRGRDLGKALSPLVSSTIKTTIRRDTQEFADIFYPVLAPSIRLMVANMIRSFMDSMNQTIESATSVQGLKWRLESIKTGVPYTELALRRSLQYRVEQVFVIQPETGLLIEHVLNENVHGIDSDAVSGMLTAIQSFVTDSFDAKSGENLTNMQVGELNVWMVHGPQALIACVIRGDAPSELRGQLIDILDQIHMKHAVELDEFDGESKIIGVYDKIEPCLQLKLKDYAGERSKTSWVTMLLFLALLLGIVYWLWISFDKNRIRNQSSKLLAKTPGVLATDVFWNDDRLNVVGLIDPMAELPWRELSKIGLEQDQTILEMKRFRSLEPEIMSKRLKKRYEIPDDLTIQLDQRGDTAIARLEGELPYQDYLMVKSNTENASGLDVVFDTSQLTYKQGTIAEFINNRIGIPQGVSLTDANSIVQIDGLPTIEWLKSLQGQLAGNSNISTISANDLREELQQAIRGETIDFERGVILLSGEQKKINVLINQIKALSYVASLQHRMPQISVVGSTDGDNTADINIKIRTQRAEYIYKELVNNGVEPELLKLSNNNNLYGDTTRGVKFRILKAKAIETDKTNALPSPTQ